LGHRVLASAVAHNIQTTALVRNKTKLNDLIKPEILSQVHIIEGDVTDRNTLEMALKGHNVVINCALTALDGDKSVELVKSICELAETHLEDPKRVWVLGGIAALDMKGFGIVCTTYNNSFTNR